jgi:hypothetical protein
MKILSLTYLLLWQAPYVYAGLGSKANEPTLVDNLIPVPFSQSGMCLGANGFNFRFDGDCNYETIKEALQDELNDFTSTELPDGCPHDAASELALMFSSPETEIAAKCTAGLDAHAASNIFPWESVTEKGDLWDKEFYDGKTYWNEEYETLKDSGIPNTPANVLKSDAERVHELFNAEAQREMITFPNHLPNFDNCELR